MKDKYYIHDTNTIKEYLSELDVVKKYIGSKDTWEVQEIGDGNLNLVFIVRGDKGAVIVKQALPYVRKAGEGWPIDKIRAWFEYKALTIEREHVGDLVPEVYYFDKDLCVIVMEFLTPHVVLRKELIEGKKFTKLSEDIAKYLANTLFKTSDLYLQPTQKRDYIDIFNKNVVLCGITEDLVFTEPYYDAERNFWNTPLINQEVMNLRNDTELKIAVQKLKYYFMNSTECLVHGDLHTGSIMVTDNETRIIDPEFAFYGPMGFDLGALFANLFLSYFSQKAHRTEAEYKEYIAWLIEVIDQIWNKFEEKFTYLWKTERKGTLYSRSVFEDQNDAEGSIIACKRFLANLQEQTLGFTAAKMIRRIVGFAHVEDIESIENLEIKAQCEKNVLKFARDLMVNAANIKTISAALDKLEL